MKKVIVGLLTTLIVISMVSPLFAENAGDKLTRGVVNTTTGWVELPKQIGETSKESNLFVGLTGGTIKGAAYTIGRTGVGAFDTLTFIIPPYDKPVLEPKYAFSK